MAMVLFLSFQLSSKHPSCRFAEGFGFACLLLVCEITVCILCRTVLLFLCSYYLNPVLLLFEVQDLTQNATAQIFKKCLHASWNFYY